MESNEILTIGDVATRFGVHPETVRRWERAGIIEPAIRRRGRRVYRALDLAKIEQAIFIKSDDECAKEVSA